MTKKINGEQPFQVLTSSFSISPSSEPYVLEISANGKDFSPLFSVNSGVTRLVTNVASGSYYRLAGNESEVIINWVRSCVTEGGGGTASGTELQPIDEFPLDAPKGTVVAYTGSSSANGVYQYDGTDWIPVGVDDLSDYYTSAQTESAITMAVSGKADAANTQANPNGDIYFPKWNSQGIITGTKSVQQFYDVSFYRNGAAQGKIITTNAVGLGNIFAPETAGSAGQILTPSGNTPVWITPATINGSAITSGGNIEIQAGGDMSAYWTSAQTESAITSKGYITSADTEGFLTSADTVNFVESGWVASFERTTAIALNDLNTRVNTISGATPQIDLSDYYTSAQTEEAITSKGYITSADTADFLTSADTQNYITSAYVQDQHYITSADTEGFLTSADTQNYITSAYVANELTAYTPLSSYSALSGKLDTDELVWAGALNDLNTRVNTISATSIDLSPYYTSAQTESIFVASQDVRNMVKISQANYDTLVATSAVSESTLYIITGTTV